MLRSRATARRRRGVSRHGGFILRDVVLPTAPPDEDRGPSMPPPLADRIALVTGASRGVGHAEAKAWDEVMQVNVTANWRLICAMDQLLKFSDAGRVVFISSGVAALALAYWGPYAVSKAALETLARTYAAETATTHVRVNLFTPGPVRTRMRAQAMPGEDPMTLETADKVAEKIVELCLPSLQVSGKLYDYQQGRFLDFCPPS